MTRASQRIPCARVALTLALVLAALLAALPTPATVAAATCTVTSTADSGNNTLRAAIAHTDNFAPLPLCDTISISATGTINLQSTLPTITRAVTITGPGQASLTIQPDPGIALANRFPLLFVNGHDSPGTPNMAVALGGLTLAGGRAKLYLGSAYGGNLRSWQANLTLTDVTLKDATGAADAGGAGLCVNSGTAALTRVTISGNSAPGSSAYQAGAGLYVDEVFGDTTVTITDSTIVGNSAATYGGGGLAMVRNSGVAGRALSVTLTNTTVGTAAKPNTTATNGGGIYNQGGTLTLTNSTVSNNTATNYGGGLYLVNASLPSLNAMTATNSHITNNAAKYGGGFFMDSTFSGGSVSASLATTNVTSNTATIAGGIFVGADSDHATTSLTLTNATIAGNAATIAGGGMEVYAGSAGANASAALTNGTVSGNTAPDASGGGLYVWGQHEGTARATLTGSTVSGNSAKSGGGLYARSDDEDSIGDLVLNTSTVRDNTATNNGGGIYLFGGSATTNGATIKGNTATNSGGGLFLGGTLTLNTTTVSGNTTTANGGGLYLAGGTMTVTNATISGNKANVNGGGLYMADGIAKLRFSTIAGNTADSDSNAVGTGGGLDVIGGTTEVRSSIVLGNAKGTTSPAADDCAGTITSKGRNLWSEHDLCPNDVLDGDQNLVSLNKLVPAALTTTLADNGGPTFTHAIPATSPARDHGDTTTCATALPDGPGGKDQRGTPRNDGHCDTGAYEYAPAPSPSPSPSPGMSPSPSPSPSPGTSPSSSPSPSPGTPVTLMVSTAGTGSGTASPLGTTTYASGQVATLTATPAAGSTFAGWSLDGTVVSWATNLTLTMNTTHVVVATFQPLPAFTDVPAGQPFTDPVQQLAARGIINGCFTDPGTQQKDFCPNENTLRHQMAALIARAMPGWADETGLPTFGDNTDDTELMTRVATLQRHNVVRGYQADVCAERGIATPPGCYGPLDTVKYGQVMLFIARAMVEKGYWTLQADDRTVFPDQNGAPGADPNTDQQTKDHRMVVTYVFYVQAVPDVANVHANFVLANGQGWGDSAPRAWFTRAFWPALQSYFGVDMVP